MEESDKPRLAQLFLATRRETFHWVEGALFQLDDFYEQTRDERIWIAEQAETLCGFIATWPADNFIHHLYVATDWHGYGVGRALLDKALAELQPPFSLKVASLNSSALSFYHYLGWEKNGEAGDCATTGPWYKMCYY